MTFNYLLLIIYIKDNLKECYYIRKIFVILFLIVIIYILIKRREYIKIFISISDILLVFKKKCYVN